MSFAWVLNLDADDELASPAYRAPTRAMRARIDALAPRLAGLLGPGDVVLGPGDVVLGDERDERDESGEPGDAPRAAYVGRAWCPTPSALARMRRAGVTLPLAPSLEVLRRANDRRFSAELGQTLPGAAFVASVEECARVVSAPGNWLAKRAFGFAGRGRRKLAGALGDDDARWVAASLRIGGVQVEPWVAIEREFAIHGVIDERGEPGEHGVVLGVPTVQVCDAHGAWLATDRARPGDLDDAELAALVHEAERVAGALARIGYFGPFGVDAYRWRGPRGACFNARGEVNARYTMGFAVGMDRP